MEKSPQVEYKAQDKSLARKILPYLGVAAAIGAAEAFNVTDFKEGNYIADNIQEGDTLDFMRGFVYNLDETNSGAHTGDAFISFLDFSKEPDVDGATLDESGEEVVGFAKDVDYVKSDTDLYYNAAFSKDFDPKNLDSIALVDSEGHVVKDAQGDVVMERHVNEFVDVQGKTYGEGYYTSSNGELVYRMDDRNLDSLKDGHYSMVAKDANGNVLDSYAVIVDNTPLEFTSVGSDTTEVNGQFDTTLNDKGGFSFTLEEENLKGAPTVSYQSSDTGETVTKDAVQVIDEEGNVSYQVTGLPAGISTYTITASDYTKGEVSTIVNIK